MAPNTCSIVFSVGRFCGSVALILALSPVVNAQTKQSVQNKTGKTVTVQVVPKGPIQAERECEQKIKQAENLKTSGDATGALTALNEAWKSAMQYRASNRCISEVAMNQGRIHMARQNFKDAVEAFGRRLEAVEYQCQQRMGTAEDADACADAHRELGIAQLGLNQNSEALAHLSEAISCYRVWTEDTKVTYEVLWYRSWQGSAMIFAGIANNRLGKKDQVRTLIQGAIQLLNSVRSDSKADDKVRSNAANLLQFAQQQLVALP